MYSLRCNISFFSSSHEQPTRVEMNANPEHQEAYAKKKIHPGDHGGWSGKKV
jgi:hypothetical protein